MNALWSALKDIGVMKEGIHVRNASLNVRLVLETQQIHAILAQLCQIQIQEMIPSTILNLEQPFA